MKRIVLLLTIIISLTGTMCSQVLFSNDFSGLNLQSYSIGNSTTLYTTVPIPFSLISDNYPNNIGYGGIYNVPFNAPSQKYSPWSVVYNNELNDTFLVSTSWLDDGNLTSDRWVLTPSVTIGPNTVITWLAMSPDRAHRDGYELYATNATGTLTSQDFNIGSRFFALPDGNTSGGGEDTIWRRRTVPIGSYNNLVGQNLRFAFRNNSKNMFQLWIDDIEIRNPFYTREVEVSSLQTTKYFLANTSQTVGATIRSLGAKTVSTVVMAYQYDNSAVNTQTYTINNYLNYLQTQDIVFSFPYTFSNPGCYPLKVWIENVDGIKDQNLGSDTLKTFVTVMSGSPEKRVLFEQFVSAYDGECSNSQDKAIALQSANLIQVNIHEGDSLKATGIDPLLNAYFDHTAKAMVDRVAMNHHHTFSSYYYSMRASDRQQAVTPANVTITEKSYDPTTRNLFFTVKVGFAGEVKGDYRIGAMLTENNVYGKISDTTVNGFNQLNDYYNVPWSQYYLKGYYSQAFSSGVLDGWRFKHQNVLLHAFSNSFGTSGSIPSNGGTAGQSYLQSFTLTLPTSTNGAYRYNADNVYIIGFVAEYNDDVNKRDVLNVTKEKLTSNSEVVSLKENSNMDQWMVYPNPSSGVVYLEEPTSGKEIEVWVFDMIGQLVFKRTFKDATQVHAMDLSNLNNGVYLMKIKQAENESTRKIIIDTQ